MSSFNIFWYSIRRFCTKYKFWGQLKYRVTKHFYGIEFQYPEYLQYRIEGIEQNSSIPWYSQYWAKICSIPWIRYWGYSGYWETNTVFTVLVVFKLNTTKPKEKKRKKFLVNCGCFYRLEFFWRAKMKFFCRRSFLIFIFVLCVLKTRTKDYVVLSRLSTVWNQNFLWSCIRCISN